MKIKALLFLLVLFFSSLLSPSKAFATRASASCSPSTGTYNVGDTFAVDYLFDTRSFEIFGADLNITYDAGVLEAADSQSTAITSVTNWSNPTTNTVDKQLGKIHLDYGNSQTAYSGSTPVGRITFKAKQAGQAQFQYTFFQQYDDTTPGVTKIWGKKDGTNLSNILTDVTNCIYVVTGPITSTPGPTSVNPTSPPGATSPPQVTELPRAGVAEVTISLAFLSFLLLTIGTVLPVVSRLGE